MKMSISELQKKILDMNNKSLPPNYKIGYDFKKKELSLYFVVNTGVLDKRKRPIFKSKRLMILLDKEFGYDAIYVYLSGILSGKYIATLQREHDVKLRASTGKGQIPH